MRVTAAASSRRPAQKKLTSRRALPGVTPGERPRRRRGRGDVTARVEGDAGAGAPPAGRAAEPAAPGPAPGGAGADAGPPGALAPGVPVSGGAAPGPEAPGDGISGVAVSGAAAGACPAPGRQSTGSTEVGPGAPRALESARWEPAAPDPAGPAPLTSRGREPPARGRGTRAGRLGRSCC